MKTYVGAKIVVATKCKYVEYHKKNIKAKGLKLDCIKDNDEIGYTVRYDNGYTSWYSADVFESISLPIEDNGKTEVFHRRYIIVEVLCAWEENALVGGEEEKGYTAVYPGGYVSWSPKDVFEKSHRELSSNENDMLCGRVGYINKLSETIKDKFKAASDKKAVEKPILPQKPVMLGKGMVKKRNG